MYRIGEDAYTSARSSLLHCIGKVKLEVDAERKSTDLGECIEVLITVFIA
jgi:hypothetical protein